ncbi:MAG: hypothetical protein ACJ763_15645 [Bdellovibrionia bacterium]
MRTSLAVVMTSFILACIVSPPQANAASPAERVGLIQQIREFSKRVGCGQLSEKDASTFASAATSKKLNVERFKNVYNVSCSFKESMEAVKDPALAQTFEQVLKMSRSNSRCSGLTGAQALKLAKAALDGDVKVHTFAVAYFSDCSFEGPFAVAQTLSVHSGVDHHLIKNEKDLERELATSSTKRSKEDRDEIARWARIELRNAAHTAE